MRPISHRFGPYVRCSEFTFHPRSKEFAIPPLHQWHPEAIQFAVDPHCGAVVEQLTSAPVISTNIYCEQRFASGDGSRIAIARQPLGGPPELWVCDMVSLRICRVAHGHAVGANPQHNAIYYTVDAEGGEPARLMRLDLLELTVEEMHRFEGEPPRVCAVSPDERWLVGGPFAVSESVYALHRVELARGGAPAKTQTLCEIADMFNPHLQFDPADGRHVVVQINRGGRGGIHAARRTLSGPLGATLSLVNVESGQVHAMPIGRPHTPGISGHECWVGNTGRLIFTAGQYKVSPSAFVTLREPAEAERHMPAAAIYSVALGESQPTVVAEGLLFNHLAASDDGRFFIADDHTTGVIYIGSIATGHYLPLCHTHTRQGQCQYSHAHAYMTPDNQFVVFNSIVTGVAQVYAARVPEGFLDQVLSG